MKNFLLKYSLFSIIFFNYLIINAQIDFDTIRDSYVKGYKGISDTSGKVLIPHKYDGIVFPFDTSSMILVKANNKYGAYNQSFKLLIKPKFDELQASFDQNRGIARIRETYFIIDSLGKKIKKLPFQHVGELNDGLAPFLLDEKFGYIDSKGEIIITNKFNSAQEFSEGLAAVRSDSLWGYINTKGEWTIKPKTMEKANNNNSFYYEPISRIIEKVSKEQYSDSKKYGLKNYEGKEIISPEYDYLFQVKNGIMLGKQSYSGFNSFQSWGLADTFGKILIPVEYGQLIYCNHHNQYIANNKVFDVKGNLIINVKNNYINNIGNYYYSVGDSGQIFNSSGKILKSYDEISINSSNISLIVGKKDSSGVIKYGAIDENLNLFLPIIYDNILLPSPYNYSDACRKIIVYKNEKCGVVNFDNKILLPFDYEEVK